MKALRTTDPTPLFCPRDSNENHAPPPAQTTAETQPDKKELSSRFYADGPYALDLEQADYLGCLTTAKEVGPEEDFRREFYFQNKEGHYLRIVQKKHAVPFSPTMFCCLRESDSKIMSEPLTGLLNPLLSLILPIIIILKLFKQDQEQCEEIGEASFYVRELQRQAAPCHFYTPLTSEKDETVAKTRGVSLCYSRSHDFYYLTGGCFEVGTSKEELIKRLREHPDFSTDQLKEVVEALRAHDPSTHSSSFLQRAKRGFS